MRAKPRRATPSWTAFSLLLLAAMAARPVHAEDREFCADRPGVGIPASTAAPVLRS